MQNVINKIQYVAGNTTGPLKACVNLIMVMIERRYPSTLEGVDPDHGKKLIILVEAVENDEYHSVDSEQFEGLAFSMNVVRRALQKCFLSNKYAFFSQPLREVKKMMKGETYNQDDVQLFITECLPAFREERKLIHRVAEKDSPPLIT